MGCGSLCVHPYTLGGPVSDLTLEMMMAIQNEQQAVGTPFGMAVVDEEDM